MKLLKPIAAAALLATAGLTFTTLVASPAVAQSAGAKATVDKAKAEGVIGETVGGYLAVVGGANATAAQRAAMDEINIGRKAVYTDLARQQNVAVEVVAKLTGEKQVAKAPPGQKVLLENGTWSSK